MNQSLQNFMQEVLAGLNSNPKTLPSKYFYNEEGSKIFQEIMDMPEYYLPEAELEIIKTHSEIIAKRINTQNLDLIELGAGDGRKMVHFIQALNEKIPVLRYFALDISKHILEINESQIREIIPKLACFHLSGDYFKTLKEIPKTGVPRLIVFAGSNIGNLTKGQSNDFMKFVKAEMQSGDFFLLGVDLKKDPKKILSAYNDSNGITKKFNLNLLNRINEELGADFDLQAFDHYATYHPITGAAESFLFSLKTQEIKIGDSLIKFEKHEVIQTEISQKFDRILLEELADACKMNLDSYFNDSLELFAWVLFQRLD
jgi:L-histidine Nalpha-methyltransferase